MLRRLRVLQAIRSDKGLTLETSAFESLYGGQVTISTQLVKPSQLERNLKSHVEILNVIASEIKYFYEVEL